MDFYRIVTLEDKKGKIIYPNLIYGPSKDIMIRGGDFYAIWDETTGMWTTDGNAVFRIIDDDLKARAREIEDTTGERVKIRLASVFDSQVWHNIRKYMSNSFDNYQQLDDELTFANDVVRKEDYRSKRLPYALLPGDYSAYDELMSTLYSPDERDKIEWCIGAIVCGRAKHIQKFLVLYGEAGTGKSTVLEIIQKLFESYYETFDAKALGSANRQFATEVFRSDPLVAIQHDGDLSKIETNETLNMVISHELMPMHVKYKSDYMARVNAFLFMGTNKPVKITDAKSGIIRRLIDVTPTGNKVPHDRYTQIMKEQIPFELGAIAYHCKEVFEELGEDYYDNYRPINMMFETDSFYNFVEANYFEFEKEDCISLNRAWALYKEYCEDAGITYKLQRYAFRTELKNYFKVFDPIGRDSDGKQARSLYRGFIKEKFIAASLEKNASKNNIAEMKGLDLKETISELDDILSDCPAQYATSQETPIRKWDEVTTTLKDLDTTKLHYVRPPENHIVIDFDLKDEDGNKCAEKNLEAAAHWPLTYAEFSKGGSGVHLHYIYDGDVSKLSALYSPGIEIKVFSGKSSLRRKLTYCNDLPVAHLNSGLPLKEVKNVVNFTKITSEIGLRELINRNLNKQIVPATKPSIDFIYKDLEKAYESGLEYDVRDMRPKILAFANNSSHQSDYCVKLVSKMKFCSERETVTPDDLTDNSPLVFYDIEVFPNLLIVCWKQQGEGHEVVRMINPSPQDVEKLMKMKLVGFNCRRYDNHVIYARYLGWDNTELYDLSQKLVNNSQNATFREAYNLSYADIYEFSSVKQSLKKFEIELGIHHQENSYPWDQPLPKEHWEEVTDYCCNDVIATEATFNARYSDFVAQEILADLTGMPVNSNGNSLAARLIFGNNRNPKLVYTDLATGEASDPAYQRSDIITAFPGYEFAYDPKSKKPVNMYRGTDLGFGGYVYAEPGMYTNVALLDIMSMHPHSAIAMNYFGEYTKTFQDLVNARIYIKHKDYDSVKKLFDGRLNKYLEDESKIGNLAYSLKIVINKVYGLTSASFLNEFKDPRNKNNIVALRGALFMRTLQDEVQSRGFKVAHIKTDSIKIPNATPEIISFCMDFAKKYGYTFEHEATYDRMCLVNNSVYIARYLSSEKCQALYGYVPGDNKKHEREWTATGAQFAQPFVYKTLFTKKPIEFKDMCETKQVQSSLYLDYNESLPNMILYENELAERLKADTVKSKRPNPALSYMSDDELRAEIAKGHDYKFVGRIGLFTPVISGVGGAELLSGKDGKYSAVTGTKGYRWLESETVQNLHLEDKVDLSYYRSLVDDAIENISKYGDFNWFVSDDSKPPADFPPDANDVPWLMPCKDPTKTVCEECEHFNDCKYLNGEIA